MLRDSGNDFEACNSDARMHRAPGQEGSCSQLGGSRLQVRQGAGPRDLRAGARRELREAGRAKGGVVEGSPGRRLGLEERS